MTREEAEIYAKTMTFEDALYNLSQARAIPYRKATLIKVNELIKALSQEPMRDFTEEEAEAYSKALDKMYKPTGFNVFNEPCDDAISREAVLKQIFYSTDNDGDVVLGSTLRRRIENLPPVTQKSGKWIETEYHRWRCSVCREKGMSEWDNIHDVRTNFCPNCGSSMKGE